MSDSEILRNECIQLAQSIEESFSSICAIWDEVGIHNQNTREMIKMEYYKSCKDVVLAHMKRMYDEEDEAIHEYVFDSIGTTRNKTID